jgi:hypothetical protein
MTRKKTNTDISIPKNKDQNLTLASCLQAVYDYVVVEETVFGGCEKETEKDRPEEEYKHLRDVLGLTDSQIEIFAVILEEAVDGRVNSRIVASRLGTGKLGFLNKQPDLDVLCDKHMVLFNQSQIGSTTFLVPESIVEDIAKNRKPDFSALKETTDYKFVDKLSTLFRSYCDEDIDFDTMMTELELLYSCCKCPLTEKYSQYHIGELATHERILFSFMVCRAIAYSEGRWQWLNYCRLFMDLEICPTLKGQIMEGNLKLFEMGLVEHDNSAGFEYNEFICFTQKALHLFIGEKILDRSDQRLMQSQALRIIRYDTITPKELFYNDRERAELDRLEKFLKPENYEKILSRFDEKNLRKGLACLFYGPPGTGKTESVFRLASGRDIYFVDIAGIRDKYVGKSEQNLAQLFKYYRKAVKENELCPILVFNEADAIFGCRKKVEDAVDQMNNSLQNILLQEVESLEGILIATTNFNNLDPAFDRRFLIKVKFDKPTAAVRSRIWTSMFTELSDADAQTLASEYELTGGLIENINRKATVDYILTGQQPNLEYLRTLCRAELKNPQPTPTRHIGFN